MPDSILDSIKQQLGIPSSDTAFDVDVITNINTAFMTLNQLGVGPDAVFSIQDNTTEWSSFLGDDLTMYSAVKTYIYLKVKKIFDAPGTSFHIDSIDKVIEELEWRLMTQVPIEPDPVVPEE